MTYQKLDERLVIYASKIIDLTKEMRDETSELIAIFIASIRTAKNKRTA